MILPVLASILFWHEVPLWPISSLLLARMGGVTLACAAICLVGWGQASHSGGKSQHPGIGRRRWLAWLAVAFLAQGGWEIVLRATRGFPDDQGRNIFVTLVFVGAALLSSAVMALRKNPVGKKELGYGTLAGVLGLLSSGSRVWALRDIDGIIVFPVTTVSVMLMVQVLAAIVWKEKTGTVSMIGFVLAVASMILITAPATFFQHP
jgi:uncharacterized membrane protein